MSGWSIDGALVEPCFWPAIMWQCLSLSSTSLVDNAVHKTYEIFRQLGAASISGNPEIGEKVKPNLLLYLSFFDFCFSNSLSH
jgi:hypothetical protein